MLFIIIVIYIYYYYSALRLCSQNVPLPANSSVLVMPMKTNMSLCSLRLAAVQILAPCPHGSAAVAPYKHCSPYFPFIPQLPGCKSTLTFPVSCVPIMALTLVKMYSFIFMSEPWHRLEGRGPKGSAGPSRTKQGQMCNRCWSQGTVFSQSHLVRMDGAINNQI